MNIEVPSRDIASRIPSIRRLLKPLVERANDLFIIPKSSTEEFVVAVHGRGANGAGSFNNLRFRTIVPNFSAMYYERWKRTYVGKEECYYLYQAYLHIYQVNPTNDEVEFLLLHCDPNEPANAAHAIYKQALHLHIESGKAEWPHDIWPHAHIALNVPYLNIMLKDINALSKAIEIAVVMLRKEVLDLLKT